VTWPAPAERSERPPCDLARAGIPAARCDRTPIEHEHRVMPSFLVSLFEAPLVPAILLGLVAAALAWASRARDDVRLLAAAGGAVAALALLLGLSWLVETPGEHAESTVARLVEAAERADFDGAEGMFAQLAPAASLHFAKETNPGIGIDGLQAAFRTLGRQHRIRENMVLSLSGETIAADRGRCELSCRTVTESSYGSPVLTRWVFDVRLDEASGRWLVQRVVFESLAGRPADASILR
jgi:hypothetical protein